MSEIVHYLGIDDELVGVSSFCDDPFCRGKERVGGIVNPGIEKVISLKPTLVICTTMTPERICESFKRFGIRTERFRLVSLKDVFRVMDVLARELGAPPASGRFKEELKRELAGLRPCLKGKRVFIALSVKPLYCAGSSTYLGQLLELAGAKVVPRGDFRAVSPELLFSLRPDLILSFGGCGGPGKVNCLDVSRLKSDLLRPGPRVLSGLEKLRRKVCFR